MHYTPPVMKVLIVDDSALIATRLRQQINTLESIEILGVANSITSALDILKTQVPDVVILDIQLKDDAPDKNGITLLSMLRERGEQPQVIMLTNLAVWPYYNKCMELGANFFLDKTTEFEKIPGLLLQIQQAMDTTIQH